MAGLGFGELIGVIMLAIVVYGKDLPKVARKLAYFYSKIRRQLTDIKDEFQRQIPTDELDINKAINDPLAGGERPPAPEGLVASAGDGCISLTWDPADDATGYSMKRTTDPTDPSATLAFAIPDTVYEDYEVEPGVSYTYVVAATNAGGESDDSNDVTASVPVRKPGAAGGNGAAVDPAVDRARSTSPSD